MSDLSPAQNERLRLALHAWRTQAGVASTAELAKRIGIKHGSLSPIVNRKGGASFATAMKIATLLGVGVEELIGPRDAQPGESLFGVTYGPGVGQSSPSGDPLMHTVTFLANLRRIPGLEAWIMNHPTFDATIDVVARVMRAWDALPSSDRGDGGDGWWSAFFQAVGDAPPPSPDPAEIGDKTRPLERRAR